MHVKGVALVEVNYQMVEVCRICVFSQKCSAFSKARQILTMSSDPHAHAQHGHGKLSYKEMCACWMPKNITHRHTITKLFIWDCPSHALVTLFDERD